MSVTVTFLGSGDAFGSGGRLQTCFLVSAADESLLVDCGASALVSIRRFGVDPNRIGLVLISHLHGDHFGGLPFLLLDAQLVSKRTSPLTIAGPSGTRARLGEAMECLFPGSSSAKRRFAVEIVELEPERRASLGSVEVTPYVVDHPSGAPAFALRIEADGRVIAYTGDTAWVGSLLPAAKDADLLIAEAYYYEKKVPYHLDYRTLAGRLGELHCRRVVLTHMSEEMLSRGEVVECEHADDGMRIEI